MTRGSDSSRSTRFGAFPTSWLVVLIVLVVGAAGFVIAEMVNNGRLFWGNLLGVLVGIFLVWGAGREIWERRTKHLDHDSP